MDVRVKKGDSIWKIAKANKPEGVTTAAFVQQILDMNNLDDPDEILPGQIVSIPGAEVPNPTTRAEGEASVAAKQEAISAPYRDPSRQMDTVQALTESEMRRQQSELQSLMSEIKVQSERNPIPEKGRPKPEPAKPEASLVDFFSYMSGGDLSWPAGRGPVPPQKRKLTVPDEILQHMGIDPGKDQSRVEASQEIMLDWDVLGMTSYRPPPSNNIFDQYAASLPPPRPAYVAQAATIGSAPDRGEYTVGDPGGLLEEGNININARPKVQNADGTFSTVRSASFNEDGVEVLIPTLDPTGRQLSDDEALQRYRDTGEFLGKFDTPESATAYAKRLSQRQDQFYNQSDFVDTGRLMWDFPRTGSEFYKSQPVIPAVKPVKGVPTPRSRPPIEKMLQMQQMVKAAIQGPSFQPTKVPNATK